MNNKFYKMGQNMNPLSSVETIKNLVADIKSEDGEEAAKEFIKGFSDLLFVSDSNEKNNEETMTKGKQ